MFDSISLEEHLVFVEVVVSIFSISKHLEWASTTIKNMQPRKGLAKSIWIRCQGDDVHSTGAVLGSACHWPKTLQETSFNSPRGPDG